MRTLLTEIQWWSSGLSCPFCRGTALVSVSAGRCRTCNHWAVNEENTAAGVCWVVTWPITWTDALTAETLSQKQSPDKLCTGQSLLEPHKC